MYCRQGQGNKPRDLASKASKAKPAKLKKKKKIVKQKAAKKKAAEAKKAQEATDDSPSDEFDDDSSDDNSSPREGAYIVHPLNPQHYTPNEHRKFFRILRNLLQPELGVNFSIFEGRALSKGDIFWFLNGSCGYSKKGTLTHGFNTKNDN